MKSFLVEQQIRVFQFRVKGLKQSEIVEIFGMSRVNVSILERRVFEKIEKVRNIFFLWEQINLKISVEVKKGEDIFQVFEKFFKKVDEFGVKVFYSMVEIIVFLVEYVLIDDRLVKRDFMFFLDREDRFCVSECILEDFDEMGKYEGGKDII